MYIAMTVTIKQKITSNILQKWRISSLSMRRTMPVLSSVFLATMLLMSGLTTSVSAVTMYKYAPYLVTTDSILDIEHSSSLQLSKFTVAAWIRTDVNTFSDPRVMIVNKGGFGNESAGKNMNYGIWMVKDGTIEGGFENSVGKNYFAVGPKLNDGMWHYVVVTYDKNSLKLYIDGTLYTSRNISVDPDSATTKPLRIGSNSLYTNENDRRFLGDVDEVRVYNRALTASEVSDAYNGIFTSSGLLVYLSMDMQINYFSSVVLSMQEQYYTLLDDIKQANSKIHMHIYSIEYDSARAKTLLNELVNAKNRGVDVRVMLDGRYLTSFLKTFFNNNNIPYKTTNLHAKVVLIDDKYAYVGSHNWKQSSLKWNNDLSIKSSNQEVINDVKAYLDTLWTKWSTAFYDDGLLEEFLTKGYHDAVLNKIENAKSSIKILMWRSLYSDNSPKTKALWDAVKNAKNRGVDVKVILDDRAYNSIKTFLKNNNIPTKLDPSSSQSTHAKTVLVDNTVFVSSANWEDPFFGTGDVTIKVIDNSMRDEVAAYFDDLWTNGRNI